MSDVVMRVVGIAHVERYTMPVWIASYVIDAFDGRGYTALTAVKARAMRFPDAGAALAAWKTQSTVRPLRDDGLPNRPLTVYTVEIERADDRPRVS